MTESPPNDPAIAPNDDAIRSGLVIALVFGAVGVATTVSFATLIFDENTPEFLNAGIAHFLLGGGVAGVTLGLLSSLRGQFGGIQDVSAAIAAVIATSVAASVAGSSNETIFANVLLALIAAAVLTSLFFIVMGRFRLGNFIRFIPFPVMAGFLAATGWLLFKGGLEVPAGGGHLAILQLGHFLDQAHLDQVALALAFGIALYVSMRTFRKNLWVLPGMLVMAIAIFYLFVAVAGVDLRELRADRWLIGPLPNTPFWQTLTLPAPALVEWDVILANLGSIATFVVVSALALLMAESGLELAIERDIDVNEEMERSGLANLFASVTGTPTSWVIPSATSLAHSRDALRPVFGALHGALLLLVFLAGPALISLFPRFVAGGLLVFLGLELLSDWIVDTYRQMPTMDIVIVITIVASVELVGFLPGVAVGLSASVIIFVVRYSSLKPIRDRLDGSGVASGRDRPIPDERLLDYFQQKTLILQLQGFIFFGSSHSVYRSAKDLIDEAQQAPMFLILDMRLVQGIDSSATTALVKMATLTRDRNAGLIVVPGSEAVHSALEQAGITPERFDHLRVFDRFDEAVGFCEDRILVEARTQIQRRGAGGAHDAFLDVVFGEVMAGLEVQEEFEELVTALRERMEEVDNREGTLLFAQHAENRHLFFIVTGLVSLERVDAHGSSMRVRTLGAWNLVGEMGAFLSYREPFTARVERPGDILALSPEALAAIELEDPELNRRLQHLIIQMLGSELARTSQVLAQP